MMRKSKITTESIVNDFKEIHGDLYDYTKVMYTSMHHKIVILCHIHGEFEVLPNHHLKRKVGCRKCFIESQTIQQTDTTENFIDKAINIHGNRYDYSLVEYGTSAHCKVKVVCKQHGEFMITPNSHLSRKSNCNKCSQISSTRKLIRTGKLGWGKTQWILRCTGRLATLYILKCYSKKEVFIKIGITSKSLKRRYTTEQSMPYQYEVLQIVTSKDAGFIYDLENIILRNTKNMQYKPQISFAGSTECRTLDFNYADYLLN